MNWRIAASVVLALVAVVIALPVLFLFQTEEISCQEPLYQACQKELRLFLTPFPTACEGDNWQADRAARLYSRSPLNPSDGLIEATACSFSVREAGVIKAHKSKPQLAQIVIARDGTYQFFRYIEQERLSNKTTAR